MFFKLHNEGKIGYKKLSEADLGLGTSHQTHIGLYDDIFTFLYDTNVEEEAMFIYNNQIDFVYCYFDRIEIPNGGGFRSPKIRKGNSISITTIIRDKAKEYPNYQWYLIWFGLENEQMVFYLFNDKSIDYQEIKNIINLSKKGGRISKEEHNFQQLLNYIEKKINNNGKSIIEDLEIASQIGASKEYRAFDLEKANNWFKDTGRKGEELIDEYLSKQKYKKQIFNYIWYNKNKETGLPYDFSIQQNNQSVIYVDVKSTGFVFERPLIFSNKEIKCISDSPLYHIYRVYDLLEENTPRLKICKNINNLATQILQREDFYKKCLEEIKTELKEIKYSINPSHHLLKFGSEIDLIN